MLYLHGQGGRCGQQGACQHATVCLDRSSDWDCVIPSVQSCLTYTTQQLLLVNIQTATNGNFAQAGVLGKVSR